MVKYFFWTVVVLLCCVYLCRNVYSGIEASDFMGVWKAEDGAYIELKNDGTCRLAKANFGKIASLDCYQNKTVTFYGEWNYKNYFGNILKNKRPDRLLLKVKDERNKVKYVLTFAVDSVKGLFTNKEPRLIRLFMATEEKYEFRKAKL